MYLANSLDEHMFITVQQEFRTYLMLMFFQLVVLIHPKPHYSNLSPKLPGHLSQVNLGIKVGFVFWRSKTFFDLSFGNQSPLSLAWCSSVVGAMKLLSAQNSPLGWGKVVLLCQHRLHVYHGERREFLWIKQ